MGCGGAQAGEFQIFLTVNETGAEAASIAEEVAIDLGIEAVVNALEFSIALAGQGIAAHSTTGTH